MKAVFFTVTILLIGVTLAFLLQPTLTFSPFHPSPSPSASPSPSNPLPSPEPTPDLLFFAPISDWQQRVTKKGFGDYVTPATSPIENDRFTGYHTGIDVEYTDTENEVPVYAVADGTIRTSTRINGYGGVTVLAITYNEKPHLALYGHLAPSSLLPNGTAVTKGQQIGSLGRGESADTDGERKHLHFSLLQGDVVDWRGYVNQESELARWLNPSQLLQMRVE